MRKNVHLHGANADCQAYSEAQGNREDAVLLRFTNYHGGLQVVCGCDLPVDQARQFAQNILACCDALARGEVEA